MPESTTRIYPTRGVRTLAGSLMLQGNWSRPLLIVDPGIRDGVFVGDILACLEERGFSPDILSEVEANPRIESANAAGRRAAESSADVVIAVGGGSALDLGKAAAMLATNGGSALDYVGPNKFDNEPLPFIAIPTTCGTGSEVSWVSVLSDPISRAKLSVKGDAMFPIYALVDADALETLPAHLIAWTGMDALTHAVEALIALPATADSDELALQASAAIIRNIKRATEGNAEAQEAMMNASTEAGLAFSLSDVGGETIAPDRGY